MSEEFVLSIGTHAIKTSFFVAAPLLIAAMVIGIVVSVFQAITQINEATLTFIPKMFAIVIVLAVMGPWMLQVMQEYTVHIFEHMGDVVR